MLRPESEDYGLYDGPHEAHPATLARGVPAACVCGWTPRNHPGYWLADHLRDMEECRIDPPPPPGPALT